MAVAPIAVSVPPAKPFGLLGLTGKQIVGVAVVAVIIVGAVWILAPQKERTSW